MALPTPIAYWPFNEATGTTAADASGNGHTATLNHGTWNTTTPVFGAAALKNTTGGYGASFASINLGTVHSIAFWMHGWDDTTSNILVGDATTNFYGCFLAMGPVRMFYSAGASNTAAVPTGATLVGLHHLVITRNGTAVTFYRDGVSLGGATLGTNTALTLSILSGAGDNTNVFAGTLDDIRLYDVALTAPQVAELFALNPDPASAFTIAQTATGSTASGASVTMTMASAPALQQSVVVVLLGQRTATVTAVTDTAGQTYTLAQTQIHAVQDIRVDVWYCATLTATPTPFTVTATGASGKARLGIALVVSGAGLGLVVDQTAGADTSVSTAGAGPTAVLTANDVLLVAACILAGGSTTITVGATSPPWVEQVERLTVNPVTGEVDTRAVTAMTGKTASVAWALGNSFFATSAIVAFKSLGPTPSGSNPNKPLGNAHGRTDENGSVKVKPVTPGAIKGPPTSFGHANGHTDDTGALVVAPTTFVGPLGPLTDLGNLQVSADETGAILVTSTTAGVLTSNFTNLWNLQGRTDAAGSLLVTTRAGGTLSTPLTPIANLQGRTDENGALIVTGLP